MDKIDLKKIKFLAHGQTLNDVLGVHFTTDSIVFMRARKTAGVLSVSEAEIFDYDVIIKDKVESIDSRIPAYLKAKYAAVAYASEDSLVKLLNFPRAVESRTEKQIAADLGLSEGKEYRFGFSSFVSENKSESSILEVGLPVSDVKLVNEYFSQHIPAASYVGVSHLGLINAYGAYVEKQKVSDVVAVLSFEPSNSALFVFNGNKLIFLRVFRTGMDFFTEEIARLMGISKATVGGIICDNAFDVSKQIEDTFKSFAHQVNLCLDFVERKEGVVIEKINLAGSSEMISEFIGEFQNFFVPKVEMFDPFEAYDIEPDVFKNFGSKKWRYATAFGVAIGLLEAK